jgi:hypothetical protein
MEDLKGKLYLCLIKYYAMKTYRGMRYGILYIGFKWGNGLFSHPYRFTHGDIVPLYLLDRRLVWPQSRSRRCGAEGYLSLVFAGNNRNSSILKLLA